MRAALITLSLVVFLGWIGTRVVMDIQFDRGAEGYLKRTADANTIELAAKNLEVAVQYAEGRGMTEGYTSILWRTPDEDVGFWHENLTASLNELRSVSPEATQLDKTNVLMKLRETLLDQGSDSDEVTVPPGITVFPHNVAFMLWGVVSFVVLFGLAIGPVVEVMD